MFCIFISRKVWEWKTINMIRDSIVRRKSRSFSFFRSIVRVSYITSKNLLSTFFSTFMTYSKNKTGITTTSCNIISYSYIITFIFLIISANWKLPFFINKILTWKSFSRSLISHNILVNSYIFWTLNSNSNWREPKYHVIVQNDFLRIDYMDAPTFSIMNCTITNLTP